MISQQNEFGSIEQIIELPGTGKVLIPSGRLTMVNMSKGWIGYIFLCFPAVVMSVCVQSDARWFVR